jgi:hypothetical protein
MPPLLVVSVTLSVVVGYENHGGSDHVERVRDVGDIGLNGGVGGFGAGGGGGGGGASMSDTGSVLGVVGGCVGFVLIGRWCVQHFSTRGIERRLEGLYGQVVAWQAAHDHQVESIDRRLRDVEKSAARAENEARMVSVQLVDMSRSLLGRIEQVERRIARGAAHTCSPGRHQGIGNGGNGATLNPVAAGPALLSQQSQTQSQGQGQQPRQVQQKTSQSSMAGRNVETGAER